MVCVVATSEASRCRDDGVVVIPGGNDEIRAQDRIVLFVLHAVVDDVLQLAGVERE